MRGITVTKLSKHVGCWSRASFKPNYIGSDDRRRRRSRGTAATGLVDPAISTFWRHYCWVFRHAGLTPRWCDWLSRIRLSSSAACSKTSLLLRSLRFRNKKTVLYFKCCLFLPFRFVHFPVRLVKQNEKFRYLNCAVYGLLLLFDSKSGKHWQGVYIYLPVAISVLKSSCYRRVCSCTAAVVMQGRRWWPACVAPIYGSRKAVTIRSPTYLLSRSSNDGFLSETVKLKSKIGSNTCPTQDGV